MPYRRRQLVAAALTANALRPLGGRFASVPAFFAGWLASELKDHLGTGVAVLCGYNSAKGGIYDYWLTPTQLLGEAEAHVLSLAAEGGEDSQ